MLEESCSPHGIQEVERKGSTRNKVCQGTPPSLYHLSMVQPSYESINKVICDEVRALKIQLLPPNPYFETLYWESSLQHRSWGQVFKLSLPAYLAVFP